MLKTKQVLSVVAILLFIQVFCFAQQEPPKVVDEEYAIKPDDKLTISVWKHPDLSVDTKVDPQGNISFPLIGKIQAAGLTVGELKDKITFLLGKDYIIDPLVTITTEKQSFYIYIYGEVRQPGAQPFEGQITLLRAITLAGGLSDFASSVVYVKRKVEGKEKRIRANINAIIRQSAIDIPLKPDDIIVVPRRFF